MFDFGKSLFEGNNKDGIKKHSKDYIQGKASELLEEILKGGTTTEVIDRLDAFFKEVPANECNYPELASIVSLVTGLVLGIELERKSAGARVNELFKVLEEKGVVSPGFSDEDTSSSEDSSGFLDIL